jgi:hypothetical protein
MTINQFAALQADRWLATMVRSARTAFSLAMIFVALSRLSSVQAEMSPCRSDHRIEAAMARIHSAADPCGESPQIAALLRQLEHCATLRYRICISSEADRNVFDRPLRESARRPLGTITWNPDLRTVLEDACDGGTPRIVMRDATASLLHELAHVAQECAGLNPGEHELEAVRIENIYRRAAGLAQRSTYGDTPLPPDMVRTCNDVNCPCSIPQDETVADGAEARPNPGGSLEAAASRRSADHPD